MSSVNALATEDIINIKTSAESKAVSKKTEVILLTPMSEQKETLFLEDQGYAKITRQENLDFTYKVFLSYKSNFLQFPDELLKNKSDEYIWINYKDDEFEATLIYIQTLVKDIIEKKGDLIASKVKDILTKNWTSENTLKLEKECIEMQNEFEKIYGLYPHSEKMAFFKLAVWKDNIANIAKALDYNLKLWDSFLWYYNEFFLSAIKEIAEHWIDKLEPESKNFITILKPYFIKILNYHEDNIYLEPIIKDRFIKAVQYLENIKN